MNKLLFVLVLLMITAGYTFLSCRQAPPAPEKAIAQTLVVQVDSFATRCHALQEKIETGTTDAKTLQSLFLQARSAYKSFEWAAEYFEPATTRFVNGPPVQEVEPLDLRVSDPAGLQVIEGLLYPVFDTTRKKELIGLLSRLQRDCAKYKTHFGNIDIFDWQVFDAAKLEVFRVITLGITGFDNPLSQQSMPESAASLTSLQKIFSRYIVGEDPEGLTIKFDSAIRYLSEHPAFNTFDRARFITACANPVTIGLTHLETRLKIHIIRYNRLLNQDAKTLFDTGVFNVNAYAPDPASFISPEKVALGKTLFSDPILSGDGTRSCRSCHQPEKAFTDGLVKNTVLGNATLLRRNTPTLLNSALQQSLFYDLRVNRLEEQSLKVVQSNEEMHGSMKGAVLLLWKDTTYRRLFSTAFPQKDRAGIDTLEAMNAIGSYVRSLTALDSRFDEYMWGKAEAMSTEEINGFNLFAGKAKCATCHYIPLFNGTFPPRFTKIDAEVIGVPASAAGNTIDPDMGRYDIIKVASLRHAFKTPTLRNASRTAPYMHNGVYPDLQQVMDFYNKGGGAGLGLTVPNQTLPFDKLDLTEKERSDIIAFIKSLDSR